MRFRPAVAALLAAAGPAAIAADLPTSPPYYPSPWADGEGEWAVAYRKAKAFVSQLTLTEKVNLTTGLGMLYGGCSGTTGSVPRLGLDGLCLTDSPLAVRGADHASVFPAGVNVAATFSKELAYARGKALGEEFRGKGVDVALGPTVGSLGQTPYGGRNWEGFSPDPVNTAKLDAETVKGMQDAGVVACVKHIVGNEQEHFRQAYEAANIGYNISDSMSANIDDVTMHELYLWPFADAVHAGAGSVMCSYNQVNNSYACQNSYLLNHLLKNELGFQGFVVSDWTAQHSGVASALAGLDMTMPGNIEGGISYWGSNLTISVLNGTVPEWRVDDMAVRIMSAYYKVHRDTHRVPPNFFMGNHDDYGYMYPLVQEGWQKINEHVNVRANHGQLIREVGAKSVVLLKNEKNVLPLSGREPRVGIIGEDAGPNPAGANGWEEAKVINGTTASGLGSGTGTFPYLVSPYEAIQREILDRGVGDIDAVLINDNTEQIVSVASRAAVSIVFASVNSDEGTFYFTQPGSIDADNLTAQEVRRRRDLVDRPNLHLWRNGDELIKTVASHCNNTIVVMHTVGPVIATEWYDNPNITAILWAGLPGQESGNSLADVLYGKVNPAGKSPFTWPRHENETIQLLREPNNGNGAPQDNFEEGVFIDYRHADKNGDSPIWEFGYGLSYVNFTYSDLKVKALPVSSYKPTNQKTKSAPIIGSQNSTNAQDFAFPSDLNEKRITNMIYPWLEDTDLRNASGDPHYGMPLESFVPAGANDSSPQEVAPAGGAPGGNPMLWDELYEISAVIENNGELEGEAVPQLYVSLGGPNDPKVVLREFDRIPVQPGVPRTWRTTLTRRDISNWDPVSQNWVITPHEKHIYVGRSSRDLPLEAKLPQPWYMNDA